jgi:GntR family transcriptional regulator
VQPLSIESYTEGVRKQGREPGRTLVGLDTEPADAALARHLETEPGASVLHLERILLSDGEPMGLESSHLPAEQFPRLHVEFDPGTSLYAYIRGTGVTFHAASEHIETVLASPREAALLGTNPALPMGGGSPRLRRGTRQVQVRLRSALTWSSGPGRSLPRARASSERPRCRAHDGHQGDG